MIGVDKAQVTLCVEIGTAGQALAPCDLVARNLWHSSLERRQASTPSSNHASTLKPIQRRPELARKCLAPERLPPASPPQRLPALLLRDSHSSSPCWSVEASPASSFRCQGRFVSTADPRPCQRNCRGMLYCILDKSVSGARIAGSLLLLLSPFELGASRNDLAGRYEAACVRESTGGGMVCVCQARLKCGRCYLWLSSRF